MNQRATQPRTSYAAEASLIFAVATPAAVCMAQASLGSTEMALLGVLIGCPIALVLALVGRKRGGEAKLVANCAIGVMFSALIFAWLIPAVGGARAAARRSQLVSNLKQIGLALHNYHSAHGRFPPAVVRNAEGQALYSWRVVILPFMEQQSLYSEFHLDERWDSPHNRTLVERCPSLYAPVGADGPAGHTFVQVFVGPGTAFESPIGESFDLNTAFESPFGEFFDLKSDHWSNFRDGTSNTILAIEAGESVPWSAPYDLPFDPDLPISRLGGGYLRNRRLFSSKNPIEDFVVLFVDGSVRTEKLPRSPADIRAKITRNGGEIIRPEGEGR